MQSNDIQHKIIEIIGDLGKPVESINAHTPLIGPQAFVKSRELVELLLALEEFAEDDLKVKFDWASDSAMSTGRSVYRTVGSLADHLAGLAMQKTG
jgi:hypothetical protein